MAPPLALPGAAHALSLPRFPITITAETSLLHPVISDREETCLEGKEGNWQMAVHMNYSSGWFWAFTSTGITGY